MKDLNIFYFDNEVGDFDKFNPRYVMEQPFCKKILVYLSNNYANSKTKKDIQNHFKLRQEQIDLSISLLRDISSISFNGDLINLNFPFFNSKDIKKIKKIIKNSLSESQIFFKNYFKKLESTLLNLYPNINPKLSLYHLICGKVFDGSMFDFLENNGLLKQSFLQKDNRDYMIIAYQNSYICNKLNKSLFCSFNHARFGKNSLTSFGNADGERFDLFRYFQLRDKNKLYGKFLSLDSKLSSKSKPEITENMFNIIEAINNKKSVNDSSYKSALCDMKYINKENQIIVPLFDNYLENIEKISKKIFNDLGSIIISSLNDIKKKIQKSNISCIQHNVDIDQICNELWHIYFGLLNKYLIDKKIVAQPQQFKGEGKYLKCIYYFDKISFK